VKTSLWACEDLNLGPLPYQQGTPRHVQPDCGRLRRSAVPGQVRWPLLNAPASVLPLPFRSQNRTPGRRPATRGRARRPRWASR